jgi:hypothetical protein
VLKFAVFVLVQAQAVILQAVLFLLVAVIVIVTRHLQERELPLVALLQPLLRVLQSLGCVAHLIAVVVVVVVASSN